MGRLDGKVAWVSGGSGGIGSATLRRFVQEGAAVVCSDIADETGQKLVAELESGGGRALYSHCDVSRLEEVKASILLTVARSGPTRWRASSSSWRATSLPRSRARRSPSTAGCSRAAT